VATWVSWSDDGVTVVCDLEQCLQPGPCADRTCRKVPCEDGGWWWQTVVEPPPGRRLSPRDLARAIDAHEQTHEKGKS